MRWVRISADLTPEEYAALRRGEASADELVGGEWHFEVIWPSREAQEAREQIDAQRSAGYGA